MTKRETPAHSQMIREVMDERELTISGVLRGILWLSAVKADAVTVPRAAFSKLLSHPFQPNDPRLLRIAEVLWPDDDEQHAAFVKAHDAEFQRRREAAQKTAAAHAAERANPTQRVWQEPSDATIDDLRTALESLETEWKSSYPNDRVKQSSLAVARRLINMWAIPKQRAWMEATAGNRRNHTAALNDEDAYHYDVLIEGLNRHNPNQGMCWLFRILHAYQCSVVPLTGMIGSLQSALRL
jgi:hypothetical protein